MKFNYSWLKDYIRDLPPKKEVAEALNLYSFETADVGGDVLEISLPPNRYADAASHIGIAREAAAALGLTFRVPRTKKIKRLKTGWFTVRIEAKDLCSRYCALLVDGVSVKSSPSWLQKRLIACGLRPINNVVDAMNYVMLELGQPLHAFDADKIAADAKTDAKKLHAKNAKSAKAGIYIRGAKKGEKITTLDNQEFTLNENVLLIADSAGSLAIAGIKGGRRAEVDLKTEKIVIESAHFDPASIYKTAKALRLKTDASERFSRGLTPASTPLAAERAFELLKEINAARAAIGLIDAGKKPKLAGVIDIRLDWLYQFLGIEIEPKKIFLILKSLEFKVIKSTPVALRIMPPPQRSDISTPEDIAEEIIRIYGYNRIASRLPILVPPERTNEEDAVREKIKDIMTSLGFSETYNYSFVSEKETATASNFSALQLLNPINDAFGYLRTSLVPRLMKNAEDNFRFFEEMRLFEIGRVYHQPFSKTGGGINEREKFSLCILVARKKADTKNVFYELKGAVEGLLERLGVTDYHFAPVARAPSKLFSPRQSAEVHCGEKTVGVMGVLSSADDERVVSLAEIDLDQFISFVEEERGYEPIARHPSVGRDISMFIDQSARIGNVERVIYAAGARYVDDVDLLDIYEKLDGEDGRKSVTFRIVFQAENRTLSDQEVNAEMKKICYALKNELGAEIR